MFFLKSAIILLNQQRCAITFLPKVNIKKDNKIMSEQADLLQVLCQEVLQKFALGDVKSTEKLSILKNTISLHLSNWMINGDPVLAGEKFVISRSWQAEQVASNLAYTNRQLIKIDPSIAFGLGHDTTTLSIKLLEKYWQGGRLLDVGTGSGILAIVATLLQPKALVEAFDIYIDVVETAQTHLEINNLTNRIELKQAQLTDYAEHSYDLICANLLPVILQNNSVNLVNCLAPGGLIIISGFNIIHQGNITAHFDWQPTTEHFKDLDTIALFQGLGLELVEKIERKGWVAAILRKPESLNE